MIPSYLNDLYLPQVFSAFSSGVDSYIHESTTDEHIVDSHSQRISGFVTASFGQTEDLSGQYFSVKNPTGKKYAMLQIDNGIIQSTRINKCDCAVINDSNLALIEFKTDAFSPNSQVLHRNYKKAMRQLSSVIGLFDAFHSSQGTDFLTLRAVEAFVCFRQGYPRSTSSQMYFQVSFAATNRGVPLSFTRNKIL